MLKTLYANKNKQGKKTRNSRQEIPNKLSSLLSYHKPLLPLGLTDTEYAFGWDSGCPRFVFRWVTIVLCPWLQLGRGRMLGRI